MFAYLLQSHYSRFKTKKNIIATVDIHRSDTVGNRKHPGSSLNCETVCFNSKPRETERQGDRQADAD